MTEEDEREPQPERLAEIVVNVDGRGRTFCGRAAVPMRESGERVIFESLVAGTVAGFFAAMTELYVAAPYHGEIDIGVALTNLKGAVSIQGRDRFAFARPFTADGFTRTARVSAAALADAEARTRDLLGRFFEASTGVDRFDPFA